MDNLDRLLACDSFLTCVWEAIKFIVNPENIIRYGGLPLIVAVVFAETGILAGFFLPGDSLLLLTGLFSAKPTPFRDLLFVQREIGIIEILIVISIAAVVGDQVGYMIGRGLGPKIFRQKKSLLFKPEYVTMTKSFYDRHGGKALVLGRFLPIIRTFAPVFAGVVELEYRRFVWYNIAGGILWVFSMCLAGFALGNIFPDIYKYEHYIVIGLIVASALPVIRTIISERALAKKMTAEEKKLKEAENERALAEIEKQRAEAEESRKH